MQHGGHSTRSECAAGNSSDLCSHTHSGSLLSGPAAAFQAGFSGLVADTFTLSPAGIEAHFGMSRGHIYHLDNHLAFDQRLPYATPLQARPCKGPGKCWLAGAVG